MMILGLTLVVGGYAILHAIGRVRLRRVMWWWVLGLGVEVAYFIWRHV